MLKKKIELDHALVDSRIWNDFPYCQGDVIISTYPKSGTTWMQQIVATLLFPNEEQINLSERSPWVEWWGRSSEETLSLLKDLPKPRFLKSHLPADALGIDPMAKYICVMRDGRQVVGSMFHQSKHVNPEWRKAIQSEAHRHQRQQYQVYPVFDAYFQNWLDKAGEPYWSFWHQIRSWWQVKDLPNVLLVHYNQLQTHLPKELERIARFLELEFPEETYVELAERCSKAYMSQHAERLAPNNGVHLKGGASVFFSRANQPAEASSRLSSEQQENYLRRARLELESDCEAWLNGTISS